MVSSLTSRQLTSPYPEFKTESGIDLSGDRLAIQRTPNHQRRLTTQTEVNLPSSLLARRGRKHTVKGVIPDEAIVVYWLATLCASSSFGATPLSLGIENLGGIMTKLINPHQ